MIMIKPRGHSQRFRVATWLLMNAASLLMGVLAGGVEAQQQNHSSSPTSGAKEHREIDPREHPIPFLEDLLSNYDKLRKPGPVDKPVPVTVTMYVLKVEDIDLHSRTMVINGYFRHAYKDSRLQHKNGGPVVVTDAEMMNRFWEPDIFLENAQEAAFHELPAPNAYVKIQPSGEVLVSKRLQLRVHCEGDLSSFPMDCLTCSLIISTYGSNSDVIRLKGLEPNGVPVMGFGISHEVVPVGYEFKDFYVEEDEVHFPTVGNYSIVKVHIGFQRLRGGFIVTTLLPCFGFVLLSYCTLFIDAKEVATKLLFNGLLLCTTYFLLNSVHFEVPRVSYLTAMDYFTGTTSFVLFWVMIVSVFLACFQEADSKIQFLPGPAQLWKLRTDRATKLGIPCFYLCFQVVFWITYLS